MQRLEHAPRSAQRGRDPGTVGAFAPDRFTEERAADPNARLLILKHAPRGEAAGSECPGAWKWIARDLRAFEYAALIAALALVNDDTASIGKAAGAGAGKVAWIVAREEDAAVIQALAHRLDRACAVGHAASTGRIGFPDIRLEGLLSANGVLGKNRHRESHEERSEKSSQRECSPRRGGFRWVL